MMLWGRSMTRLAPHVPVLRILTALALGAVALAALAMPSPAFAQGQIGTIERGQYVCELPGDAGRQVGVEQTELNFRIASASRYITAEGSGTYLRRGDIVIMTSGPRQGESYAVMTSNFLRKIENGQPGRLRCLRHSR